MDKEHYSNEIFNAIILKLIWHFIYKSCIQQDVSIKKILDASDFVLKILAPSFQEWFKTMKEKEEAEIQAILQYVTESLSVNKYIKQDEVGIFMINVYDSIIQKNIHKYILQNVFDSDVENDPNFNEIDFSIDSKFFTHQSELNDNKIKSEIETVIYKSSDQGVLHENDKMEIKYDDKGNICMEFDDSEQVLLNEKKMNDKSFVEPGSKNKIEIVKDKLICDQENFLDPVPKNGSKLNHELSSKNITALEPVTTNNVEILLKEICEDDFTVVPLYKDEVQVNIEVTQTAEKNTNCSYQKEIFMKPISENATVFYESIKSKKNVESKNEMDQLEETNIGMGELVESNIVMDQLEESNIDMGKLVESNIVMSELVESSSKEKEIRKRKIMWTLDDRLNKRKKFNYIVGVVAFSFHSDPFLGVKNFSICTFSESVLKERCTKNWLKDLRYYIKQMKITNLYVQGKRQAIYLRKHLNTFVLTMSKRDNFRRCLKCRRYSCSIFKVKDFFKRMYSFHLPISC